ncbi:antibiotic biosynthesis monooxygenase [Marinobacter lutaoensis]|jgi:heme-degrading monooxygenase HmoA|uniref:Antibiotic biosynthesis monooxygenase n=1 Tax=Marinobacter lutaoensis TaxID=135739 RepID=A0A1V2DXD4_9GAMM|nr:antibiotic biosynthesis monooxygenase [Marinobacter lutaoensis]MBE02681.1 antibiotic biosynthesis monooxygenase [Marinobacter sp.]MBI42649.1 antibiotic biosynthesis monooxygenase [Oceanospirillales bacterium]NVD35368.1 antibiotic biosynthesis monooxygenase [Marinobacter lutaoensis]ONF45328.1 antibiotic biosynthesis monooxygenase [Marinobacter lutaoensis]|tara:strand:+ start:676 stop:966 length:291 start_codon:yes stop_codon:yes gene_type:complete
MIRVLIERHIAESLEDAYEQRARRVLQQAVAAPGFVSGETLLDAHDPNHRITLANWRSEADWNRWYHSDERKELMAELIPMMDREETITVLEQSAV